MSMFYVKEKSGKYRLAPAKEVLREANRLCDGRLERGALILSSADAKTAIGYRLRNKQREVNACLFLDSSYRVLAFKEMFQGTINRCAVYHREIIKECLRLNAAAIILAHNHPSGDSKPSVEDIALTKVMRDILQIVEVKLLDHLVIGDEIYSLADSGFFRNEGPDFCRLKEDE